MKLQQKGFTLIEGLLIIIALTMVSGVGYYVYSQNKDDDKAESTSISQTQETKPADEKPSVDYVEFKELGFKIKKTEKMKDWVFLADDDFSQGRYVQSSAHVKQIDDCNVGAANPPLGISPSEKSFAAFSKIEGTYRENTEDITITGKFMKQFDTFYISASYPNGGSPCFNEQGVGYPVARSPEGAHQELETALKNAEEL